MKINKKIIILIFIANCIFLTGCQSQCKKGNHKYNDWVVDVEATCDEDGIKRRSCEKCDYIEEEIIDKKNHDLNAWEVVNEPSYTSDGLEERTCNNCEYKEEKVINRLDPVNMINEAMSNLVLPTKTMDDIIIPTFYEDVTINWLTSDNSLLTIDGKIGQRIANDQTVFLQATFTLGNASETKVYEITILGFTNLEKIEIAFDKLTIPSETNQNLELKTTLSYGVKAEYHSSNHNVLLDNGQINPGSEDIEVTLTIILSLGSDSIDKEYKIKILKFVESPRSHLLIERSTDFVIKNNDLEIIENKLVLKEGVIEAVYESSEVTTELFKSLVASFSTITSTVSTCELKVSVKVNDVWSDFITYGKWGLGLQNASYDQTNSLIKLSTDEVKVLNNQKGSAIKYQLVLRRDKLTDPSPKVSLVAFALEIENYNYFVKTTTLPSEVCHNVPRLYQGSVPVIGSSICSATSTTMMLKYKGLDFTNYDSEYEHRYIAGIVRDYGNQIYGNWVYNTVTMGAYGFDAYVARMYSIDELRYYLANYGPVALSVKGTMTSTESTYTTNGHLIVAIGYKFVDDKLYIICNDPNVRNVYCEYSIDVINNTWRNIAYVME